MNKKTIITALLALVAMTGRGQTDTKGGILSGIETDVQPFDFSKPMMANSLHFQQIIPSLELLQDVQQKPLTYDRTTSFPMPANNPFMLWNGAGVTVYGSKNQMLGLMDAATGTVSLHQDFGRLHFAASAVANKYWMPMQSQLYTQYGIGGNVSFEVSEHLSLHAFGYYYNINPTVGPALSPYISTTAYGGYADIRFSDHAGSNVGIRRYLNPMSGRWTTEPIVTPYFRIGKKMRLELPVGGLLKAAIWGDRDNPLRFQPRPMPTPQQKQ